MLKWLNSGINSKKNNNKILAHPAYIFVPFMVEIFQHYSILENIWFCMFTESYLDLNKEF